MPKQLLGKVNAWVDTLQDSLSYVSIPYKIASNAEVPLDVAIIALLSSIFNISLARSSRSWTA